MHVWVLNPNAHRPLLVIVEWKMKAIEQLLAVLAEGNVEEPTIVQDEFKQIHKYAETARFCISACGSQRKSKDPTKTYSPEGMRDDMIKEAKGLRKVVGDEKL